MKILIQLLLIFTIIVSCKRQTNKQILVMNLNCDELKKSIQKEFDLSNLTKTIELYKDFEKCLNDEQEFHTKLGLLYKENNQPDLCKKQFTKVINLIENDPQINAIEKSISKASIYLLMDDNEKVRKELSGLNREKLTDEQTQEIELFDLFVNQGEYIMASVKTDFKLFE